MDAGIEVKVEDYDGTYECLFCGESVRGQPALKCSHCSSNPFHVACVARADSKYAEVCPTCDRKTVEAWVREKQQDRECRKSSAGQRSQEEERAALNPARSTALEQAPLGGGKAPLRLSASQPEIRHGRELRARRSEAASPRLHW